MIRLPPDFLDLLTALNAADVEALEAFAARRRG
jgi:hypothetical protein